MKKSKKYPSEFENMDIVVTRFGLPVSPPARTGALAVDAKNLADFLSAAKNDPLMSIALVNQPLTEPRIVRNDCYEYPCEFLESEATYIDRYVSNLRAGSLSNAPGSVPSQGIAPQNMLPQTVSAQGVPARTVQPQTVQQSCPTNAIIPNSYIPAQGYGNPYGMFPSSLVGQSTPGATAQQKLKSIYRFKYHKGVLRYFDGRKWVKLTTEDLGRLISASLPDVLASNKSNIVKEIEFLFAYDPTVYEQEFAAPVDKLAFQNCVLDLNTMDALPFSDGYYFSNLINAEYHASNFYSPYFDTYLHMASGGNPDWVERVYQMIGYILSPDIHAKKFFILQGVPDSGKSLLGALIQNFFEEEQVVPMTPNDFASNFALGNLEDKRLCVALDLPSSPIKADAISALKMLTGNDSISSDVKFKERIKFQNTAKLLYGMNGRFLPADPDVALFQRVVCIPFAYSVPKNQQDPLLSSHFQAEMSVIATKAMAAYQRLRKNNYIFAGDFPINQVLADAPGACPVDKAPSPEASIERFLRTNCAADPELRISNEDLYRAYCQEEPFPMANYPAFVKAVKSLIPQIYPQADINTDARLSGPSRSRGIKGLGLAATAAASPV